MPNLLEADIQAAWGDGLFDSQRIPNSSISLIGYGSGITIGTSTNATVPSLLLSLTVHIQEDADENTRPAGSPQELFSGTFSPIPMWLSAHKPHHGCPLFTCPCLPFPPHSSEKATLEVPGQFLLYIWGFGKNPRLRISLLHWPSAACLLISKSGVITILLKEVEIKEAWVVSKVQSGMQWKKLF